MQVQVTPPTQASSTRRYLTICGLQELGAFQNAAVTHVLSILDPGHPEPADFALYGPHKRLTLRFDDIIDAAPGMMLPERHHIEALLEFGKGLAAASDDPLNHLLVHCHAGISRSTASMAILLAEARPETDEDSLFAHIREIRAQAWPNSRMIAMADDLLGRQGRLVAALRRHYTAQMRLRPDLAEMIGRVGRQQEVEMAS
jgi:predicted protein tyrosine phosphatase